MTHPSLSTRRTATPRLRTLKLALVGLAAGLSLAACARQDGGLSGSDVDLALQTLKAAPAHGIAAEPFHIERIEKLVGGSSADDKRQGQVELKAALVAYARAQHGLTTPKSAFPQDWGLKPAAYDAQGTLDRAIAGHHLKDWLAEQPTPLPAYRALQGAYVNYLKIAAAGGWPLVDGSRDPQGLVRRLAFEDPQLAGAQAGAAVDLTAAVQRFQTAHGLTPTGRLDAATLQEINVPAIARAAQIRANLERLRWLPRQEPATRVDVNTAAATMAYYRDGQVAMSMLSASGKPDGDETPMLASAIDNIVLNPPWNVPDQIAQEEIIPKGEAYLQEKGFVMQDGRLVQKAGPEAALGLVKFDFDNPYSVYLHDTPSKAAFGRTSRAVSHGCVRLARAVDFAKLMLSQDAGWSAERVDQVLASGETTHVKLTRSTPVRLIYLTAFVDGGRINFRPDVYGWDRQMLELLDHPPAPRKAAKRT